MLDKAIDELVGSGVDVPVGVNVSVGARGVRWPDQ
jgi:hypothetical protein